jgi:chromosome segregation ATPase
MKSLVGTFLALLLCLTLTGCSDPTYEQELRDCLLTLRDKDAVIEQQQANIKELRGVLAKKQEEVLLHRSTPSRSGRELTGMENRIAVLEAELDALKLRHATLRSRHEALRQKLEECQRQ